MLYLRVLLAPSVAYAAWHAGYHLTPALVFILLGAIALLWRTRQDAAFLRRHRDELANTLALVARKRGRT